MTVHHTNKGNQQQFSALKKPEDRWGTTEKGNRMTKKRESLRRLASGLGALALAVVGTVAFAGPASAGYPAPDGTGSLTIHKHVENAQSTAGNPAGAPLAGVQFSVQQVGTGDPCVAIDLSTPAGWQAVKAAIDGFNDTTGALPAGYCLIGTPTLVTTGADGQTPALTGLDGLYVVKEVDPGPNLISMPAAPFLVTVPMPVPGDLTANPATVDSWDYSVDAYPKNVLTTTTPTKTVATENVDAAVTPGAVVPWTVTVPIPVAAFPYNTITVTDVPADGHTFTAFGDVELNGTPLAGPSGAVPDYTVSGSTITLTAAGLAKVNALVTGPDADKATLTIDLTTTVTGDVVGPIVNKANVTLNGQTTPTTEPETIWGKLSITKHVAGNVAETLQGAEFAVYVKTEATCAASVESPALPVTTLTTSVDGVYTSVALWIANAQADDTTPYTKAYCVVETKAPAGYLLDPAPREVVLSTETATDVVNYNFPNTPPEGPELPMTGAQGTMLLSVLGLALVAVAGGGFLVRRARTNH